MTALVRGLRFKLEPGDSGFLSASGYGQFLLLELLSFHGQSVSVSVRFEEVLPHICSRRQAMAKSSPGLGTSACETLRQHCQSIARMLLRAALLESRARRKTE